VVLVNDPVAPHHSRQQCRQPPTHLHVLSPPHPPNGSAPHHFFYRRLTHPSGCLVGAAVDIPPPHTATQPRVGNVRAHHSPHSLTTACCSPSLPASTDFKSLHSLHHALALLSHDSQQSTLPTLPPSHNPLRFHPQPATPPQTVRKVLSSSSAALPPSHLTTIMTKSRFRSLQALHRVGATTLRDQCVATAGNVATLVQTEIDHLDFERGKKFDDANAKRITKQARKARVVKTRERGGLRIALYQATLDPLLAPPTYPRNDLPKMSSLPDYIWGEIIRYDTEVSSVLLRAFERAPCALFISNKRPFFSPPSPPPSRLISSKTSPSSQRRTSAKTRKLGP